jgi:hypothetical protein
LLAIAAHASRLSAASRLDRDDAPGGGHGIQHRADAARQRARRAQRRGGVQRVAAADEARAVGLVRGGPSRRAVHRHDVEGPGRTLVGRTRPPRAQQGLRVGEQLGLHEQLAERRVRRVGRRRCEHQFGIGRQLDRAPAAAAVGQPQAPQFQVVLRRDDDLGVRIDAVVPPAEFGATFAEHRLEPLARHARGLQRRRPDDAAVDVAQVAEAAPGVGGAVLAPSSDGHVLPAAVAAAGVGEHHVIAAVREQLHLGRRRVRRGDHPRRRLDAGPAAAEVHPLCHLGLQRHRARHAFLQQQQRGAQRGVGLESALHRPVQQQVGQRKETHALVVGHV